MTTKEGHTLAVLPEALHAASVHHTVNPVGDYRRHIHRSIVLIVEKVF